MKNYKLYIVGGFVRDKLLGIKSKDVDYAFEYSEEYVKVYNNFTPIKAYEDMNDILEEEGFEIFLETPDCFTTRAKFPKNHINKGLTADFVMCRKETYPDALSRQPLVEIGNLYDDLYRRDFRVNAMALSEDGVLIDPFNGSKDIENKILSCPKDAMTSFMDDPLRAIRCMRFAVTKNFKIDDDCKKALKNEKVWSKLGKTVSRERVREELLIMFKHDTLKSVNVFYESLLPGILHWYILKDDIWLKPTTEKK